jgi:hypothetical protein
MITDLRKIQYPFHISSLKMGGGEPADLIMLFLTSQTCAQTVIAACSEINAWK